ncbi:hypothetical protein LQZ19_00225 [Treponema primitia]|uniref:hypothetical protein n=1 Tax=Treponema primitia TaxID=88058 RepID=UPI00397F10F4
MNCNKSPHLFIFILLLILSTPAAFAQDFGLTLRQLPLFRNGDTGGSSFEYTGTVIPWFAAPLGEQGDLYFSGGFSMERADDEWQRIPEIYRFEMRYRFKSGLRMAAGRSFYQEASNTILSGLFDGLSAEYSLGKTKLSARAFYTGLLYKKDAYITMSDSDYADYHDRDVYFSSRRVLFSLNWGIPALFNTDKFLKLGMIGQFDLNDSSNTVNSQYGEATLSLPFLDDFNADLGAVLGLLEKEPGDNPLEFCFALRADLVWLPPGPANDRFFLGASFSSGAWNDQAQAFLPISTIAQGRILRPKLSGIALIQGSYTRRLHKAISAEGSAAYFFRTDTTTYRDTELDTDSRSPLLGGELAANLIWAPVSDIAFTLGGGAFLPQTGKAFASGAAVKWRVSLETLLSF